jgi:uncharacterized tellurite resistance protein B-like protein
MAFRQWKKAPDFLRLTSYLSKYSPLLNNPGTPMLTRVLDFLAGHDAPVFGKAAAQADDLELSVAALLIEAARMDNDFDAAERATIERLLMDKFKLSTSEARGLIEQADAAVRDSTQVFPFTRQICESMSLEDRTQIIEMLWKVVYADGVLDPYEDMLLRRIAGLIYVPDRERGMARQRALAHIAAAKAAAHGAH